MKMQGKTKGETLTRSAIRITGYTNDCETVTIGENSTVAVRVGREVTVRAETIDPEFAYFRCWNAPGLPIHRSDKSVETFVVPKSNEGYDITATAVKTWDTTLFLPSDNVPNPERFSLCSEGSVETVVDDDERYIGVNLTTPLNEPVTVSYALPCPDGVVWELANNGTTGDAIAFGSTITVSSKAHLLELAPICTSCIGEDGCNTKTSSVSSTAGIPHLTPGGVLSSDVLFPFSLTRYANDPISCPLIILDPEAICGYQYDKTIQSPNASGGTNFHHKLKPAHTLALGYSRCKGYVTSDPAQKYYNDNEIVRISAHALPGYTFAYWGGKGTAWLLEAFGALWWDRPLTGTESSSIYVKMNQSKSIIPVFQEAIVAIFTIYTDQPGPPGTIDCYQNDDVGHSWWGIELIDPSVSGCIPDEHRLYLNTTMGVYPRGGFGDCDVLCGFAQPGVLVRPDNFHMDDIDVSVDSKLTLQELLSVLEFTHELSEGLRTENVLYDARTPNFSTKHNCTTAAVMAAHAAGMSGVPLNEGNGWGPFDVECPQRLGEDLNQM